MFFSASYLALRHISWVKIEEAFTLKGNQDRTETLRRLHSRLILAMATWRLLANLVLLFCVVYNIIGEEGFSGSGGSSSPEGSIGSDGFLWPMLEGFLFAAVILGVCSVAIPQAWSKYAATSLLVRGYPLLVVLDFIMRPLTIVFHLFDPVVRRLAGVAVDNANGRLEERQEELLNVVEEGHKEGVVDEEEREMIESVLEFRDTTVGEIMTPRTEIVGIDAKSSLKEAVEIVIREGHSRYPVFEENIDEIIGMLYAKDILREFNNPDESGDIRHRLRKPFFVPESKKLRNLLHDFQNQKVHVAVVLDEYGGTAGLVSIEDILEELVGEIVDEYEEPQAEVVKKINEYTWEVDARLDVDEINDEFNLTIPEDEDYETIGGFAFSKLGHIPKKGETFSHDNMTFEIIDVEERKINRIRIRNTPPSDESPNGKHSNHS
ncbi:MAG: HlyC/CorC family transporter [Sedimentisphaerales bacterium]|nr:HlyC/CorC family transporter [Sedimentisphaerales bacterium]